MKTRVEKIKDFLKTITVDGIDIPYLVDAEEVNSYDDVYEAIDSQCGFVIEITYHPSAMDFLKREDPSLQESMRIASEFCYQTDRLNSELLASLLASEMARDEFALYQDAIQEFFDELEDDEDDEDDEY